MSISGDTALVGARLDNLRKGSAYVLVRDGGGNWTQQAKLRAADGAADDLFGSSVSLSGDTALVGVVLDDDAGSGSGATYVFCAANPGAFAVFATGCAGSAGIPVLAALPQDLLLVAGDGRIVYRFRQPWRNGKQAVVMDPMTFLSRIAAQVPPPRFHMLSYHGVLSPAAPGRSEIVRVLLHLGLSWQRPLQEAPRAMHVELGYWG